MSRAYPPAPSASPPLVADHKILRRIGAGAYGEVWLAQSVTGVLRAVKIVRREQFDHDRTYEREFAGLKRFEPVSRSHEGFVDILQVGRDDTAGYFYCVMELADNAGHDGDYTPLTLDQMIRARRRIAVNECAQIGAAAAGALSFLHKEGLVHRDVKPANIVFVNGYPKLADIGLVSDVGAARSFVGTEGFIPPEGPGAPRGDIFSLGKTLYEMATGLNRLDFPDLPSELAESPDAALFVELNEIILRACAEDPDCRHQTAVDLRAELLLIDAGRSIRKIRRNERLLKLWRRIGLATSVIVLIIAALFAWERRRAEIADREAAAQSERRQTIETKERAARQNLYAADMNLAQQAIESGNWGRAWSLLSAYLPQAGAEDLRGIEWFYYWNTLRGDSVGVLSGHNYVVSCLALSPDGKRLYSGSFDSTIREWSLDEAREIRRWTMPGCLFAAITLDASGKFLAGEGGNRRFSTILNLETGAWTTNVSTPSQSIAFAPGENARLVRSVDMLIFGTNSIVEVTDEKYQRVNSLPESGGRLTFSKSGELLATGPWGGQIKLWSWPELRPVGVLNGASIVLGMSFSPDERALASVSQDGVLRVWDLTTMKLLAEKNAHRGTVVWSVAFSPDGQRLVTAGTDQTVRTWSLRQSILEETHVYRGHASEVWSALWSHDGTRIISSGKDATIRIWDANPALPPPEILNVKQRPVFSRDSRRIATRVDDGVAVVWDLPAVRENSRFNSVTDIGGFSANGNEIIVLRRDGHLQTLAIPGGEVVRTQPLHNLPESPAKRLLSPSGRWLVDGMRNGEIILTDVSGDCAQQKLLGHQGLILALALSDDEQRLLTGSIDRTARLWHIPTATLIATFENHRMGVGALAFSSDSNTIGTGSWDDTIHIWDVAKKEDRIILPGHEGGVQALAFAPHERTLAAITGTSVLKLWSLSAQREAGQLRLRSGVRQAAVTISPDGQWVAAVSQGDALSLLYAPRENIR